MKRLIVLALLLAPVAFGTRTFFGPGAPAAEAGNLPGDLFIGNHVLYFCDAPQGKPAPACNTVAAGNWTPVIPAVPVPPVPTPSAQWSMGFWSSWGPDPAGSTAALDWTALTHLIVIGVEPQSNGSLKYSDTNYAVDFPSLIATARTKNVKVLLNVWSGSGSDFAGAIKNNLPTLTSNIMGVVTKFGFDGVDVDWESGLSANFPSMTTLLISLKSALAGKTLTADASSNDSAYWGTAAQYVDRVSVMTYDMPGTWNPYSWVNSALYSDPCNCVWSFELARTKMLAAGVPASKLNMGLPFYGWTSTGGGITGPRQQWQSTLPSLSQINYYAIVARYNISNPTWDAGTRTPFITIQNGWLTFDNERSITEKINYVKANGLGGWIIWAIDQDYIPGAAVKHPLLSAVAKAR